MNQIREMRSAMNLSAEQLAERVGTSQQQISRLEKGERRLTEEWMRRIAQALHCSPTDLLDCSPEQVSGATDLPRDNIQSGLGTPPVPAIDDFARIPRYDAAASAGPGSIVDPNAEVLGYYLFERQWLDAITRACSESLAVIRVAGDSMETTLADGDWILIDRSQRRLNHEGVYAIQVGDMVWIKRITINLKSQLVQVISDNPHYPLQELPEESLSVIGRAVWIVGRKV